MSESGDTNDKAPGTPRRESPRSSSMRAYAKIRELIASGHYKPGERLKEDELTAVCSLSRTPVRAALHRLNLEGFITLTPNHGARVTAFDVEDLRESIILRAMIEAHAAERAATRIGSQQIDRLKELAAIMEQAVASGRAAVDLHWSTTNLEFHKVFLDTAMSPQLSTIASLVTQVPQMLRSIVLYQHEDLLRAMRHHRELISAMEAHDPEWASAVMRNHIFAAFHSLARHNGKSSKKT
ncbi:MAG: GntR family transcriptional regulator [Pseudomonas sp.]